MAAQVIRRRSIPVDAVRDKWSKDIDAAAQKAKDAINASLDGGSTPAHVRLFVVQGKKPDVDVRY